MELSSDNILIVGSLMLFVSILMSKMSYRFGIPSLLLFLCVGMVMGQDGFGLKFDSAQTAQFIGMMALSAILFSGGMDTKISEIRPVIAPGIILATFGVVLTAGIVGTFIWAAARFFEIDFSFPESLLLAAVMSSTDSASVFSLLRTKGLLLKENLRPTLELESGSNDPMAYLLTLALIQYIQTDKVGLDLAMNFVTQLSVGTIAGYLMGRATVWIVNTINLDNRPLYSVLLISCVFFTFSATNAIDGNGYLAVYLAGLVVGNKRMVHRKTMASFFEDFAWLWQIVMFVSLGLLVNPKELLHASYFALAIGFFMIFLGRPLAVYACIFPFKRFSQKAKMYISWVGLRGAVPIIFATYPLLAEINNARAMFNVVFFITILSLVVQGMSVNFAASLLGVAKDEPEKIDEFGLELPEEIKSALSEININESALANGNTLKNLNLPDKTLVIMLKRDGKYSVPKGNTVLYPGDKVLIISDNQEELRLACARLGVENYTIQKNA